ncbi:MAG TPA: [LysW]-lysine hydrolase [Anaerolineae bacterium]|nr:[LysW]-lysine hydrolase [Anaerolineae bacterium]
MNDLEFLEKLLAIPSPSGGEDIFAEYLIAQMRKMGFVAHRDEAGNVVGTVGNPAAENHVVLLGHMDTVPGFIPVRWEGDTLYGRGAVDAKGPLTAFVLAAAQVAPKLTNARVTVIGAVEEESHGWGSQYLAQTMAAPSCAIIGEPSAWDCITLGYKGRLLMEYSLTQPGGHSAGEFVGPAEHAVTFWNSVRRYAGAYNQEALAQGRKGRFYTLDPALRDLHTYSDGLNDYVEMTIVARLPPGFGMADLLEKMDLWAHEAKLTFRGSDPAYQSEKNTPPVRALLRAIRAEGGKPAFKLKTGTSDMNTVGPVWECPMVAYGPGDSSLDHTPHEHIDAAEFRRGVAVLARALETLGGG